MGAGIDVGRGLAETSYWGDAAGVVVDVCVKLRPPWEQTRVVVLEDNSGGGAASARQRQVQVELALHRRLMELQHRED
jgi:hypothetical protein